MQESHKLKCENKNIIQRNGYIEKEYKFTSNSNENVKNKTQVSPRKHQDCKTPENVVR